MTGVKEDRPDHIFVLLDEALRALRPELSELNVEPGVRRRMRGLRSSQLRLLGLTPPDGLRVTDLAERVGMTKQALGEFATALEERGLMETVRDERDRRVRILRPTRAGRDVARASDRAIREMEQGWRARVGAERWDAMRAGLAAIGEAARSAA